MSIAVPESSAPLLANTRSGLANKHSRATSGPWKLWQNYARRNPLCHLSPTLCMSNDGVLGCRFASPGSWSSIAAYVRAFHTCACHSLPRTRLSGQLGYLASPDPKTQNADCKGSVTEAYPGELPSVPIVMKARTPRPAQTTDGSGGRSQPERAWDQTPEGSSYCKRDIYNCL